MDRFRTGLLAFASKFATFSGRELASGQVSTIMTCRDSAILPASRFAVFDVLARWTLENDTCKNLFDTFLTQILLILCYDTVLTSSITSFLGVSLS